MLLPDAVTRFIDSREHCSKSTIVWYTQMLAPLAQHFATFNFEAVTLDDLRAYLKKRRAENSTRGGPRAGASLNGERKALKIFFKAGQREGWRPDNPATQLGGIQTMHRRVPLSHDETIDILDYLMNRKHKHSLRDLALFVFFLDSAARREEVHRLRIEDLNLREGYASILGKGDKTRTVDLTPLTCDILKRYLAGRFRGPLFLASRGNALSAVAIRKVFDSISRATGVHIHPHKMRMTSAVLSYLSGMGINDLRLHLGHSNISTTCGYIWAAEEQRARESHRVHSPLNDVAIRDLLRTGTSVESWARTDFDREKMRKRFRIIK